MTAEQFELRYSDVPYCELERGEVVRLMAGGWEHSRISYRIARLLGDWAEQSLRGRVLTNEAGLITERDPDTVRGVDVAYFSYERIPVGHEPDGFATVAPEPAVEVVGKRQGWGKIVEKAGEYLRMGVERVSIVNPATRTVHVFRPDADPERFGESNTLSDPVLLPGFACAVRSFFND